MRAHLHGGPHDGVVEDRNDLPPTVSTVERRKGPGYGPRPLDGTETVIEDAYIEHTYALEHVDPDGDGHYQHVPPRHSYVEDTL